MIALSIQLELHYQVRLELLDVRIDGRLHRSPLVTTWTMRFTGQKKLDDSDGCAG